MTVDIFPGSAISKADSVRGDTNDRPIFLMGALNVLDEISSRPVKKINPVRDSREDWSWIFRERVEIDVVDCFSNDTSEDCKM